MGTERNNVQSQAQRRALMSTARQGTCFIPIVVPMGKLWGAYGLAGVQAAADLLSLILAVRMTRRIQKMCAAQEALPQNI